MIGFIGTGVMGKGIIRNLINKGEQVVVFNRTKAHAEDMLEIGAKWADTPAELVKQSDVIFTMVGFPKDVEEVYFGEQGIFSAVKSGQYLVDLTTSKPSLARRIGLEGEKLGVHVLDAPVSGGDIGAKNGALTIMVGGQKAALEYLKPTFLKFGKQITYFGSYGSGQHTKMANQIMIAGTMTGMTEMFVYAKAAGLDLEKVMKTLQGGAAENFSLGNYGPRILCDDYTPGFFAKHFLKDLRIALEEAEAMNLDLPNTKQAKELYDILVNEKGLGNDGTQALIKLWWQK